VSLGRFAASAYRFHLNAERSEQQKRALEESEQFRTALVEQVKDYAIFRTDTHGIATTWNEGVQRVLGYSQEEFVGGEVRALIFTVDAVVEGIAEREFGRAVDRGSSSNDRWMRRKDGSYFWASGITTALRNAAGDVIGFTKIMRDMTEMKRAQHSLK